MLAALLLTFYMYFGGGNDMVGTLMTQQVKEQVKIAIPDKDRRKLALKGLSVVNDDIKDLNQQVSKDLGQMEKLIKDYDSKPEDFDRLFTATLTKRNVLIDKIWDDRKAMLQHVTTDEWQTIISNAKVKAAEKAKSK